MNGLDPKQFYGVKYEGDETKVRKRQKIKHETEQMPLTLLGPSRFWVEFQRQCDAISLIREQSSPVNPLSLFVYQDEESFRHFIVAHPETYWWTHKNRELEKLENCFYEVIIENEPSYIYFDLEFMKEQNPNKDGIKMTQTLTQIVFAYMVKNWDTTINEKNVVILDSTTESKFSRHLIFNTRDVAFTNNFHVGKLVKQICKDVLEYVFDDKPNDVLKLFKKADLENLVVVTDKGNKLFVDTAVYSKNRHFRLYKCTKWGKNAYLEVAKDCKYVPRDTIIKDKKTQLFLDTLISFFPDKTKLKLLEFNSKNEPEVNCYVGKELLKKPQVSLTDKILTTPYSPYIELDKHIKNIIRPGRIRCCKYYTELNRLVYEILGNRFCKNIGRQHKSNNIYWVVELTERRMYQKCHDEDCQGFASEPESLPEKVCFEFDDDFDVCLSELPEP